MSTEWTDAKLAEKQEHFTKWAETLRVLRAQEVTRANGKDAIAEVYRLARLGLSLSKACSWGTHSGAPLQIQIDFERSGDIRHLRMLLDSK